ncbi:hypothetical protein WISP_05487 [Willisornis vidua]|uniref:Uncharacterized protein n=1 Tax=Willisornis vidua TaxID=1566151 RepID=A0ABQ9DTP7_9PASS|nr:hypothetical protein WISP_05487 [Willisornis vidua]
MATRPTAGPSYCEASQDWKKGTLAPNFKRSMKEDPENYELVSLTSILGKMVEQLILETISRHMKDKKVNRISHYEFTKEK